jgi:myo-inositol-1(or 4)-monophosphatase
LVAAGAFDGAASLGYKNEWDIAAGAALVIEAQGAVSDPWGGALTFNQAEPLSPGIVAAGPQLHPLLIERLSVTPHPRTFPRTAQD